MCYVETKFTLYYSNSESDLSDLKTVKYGGKSVKM